MVGRPFVSDRPVADDHVTGMQLGGKRPRESHADELLRTERGELLTADHRGRPTHSSRERDADRVRGRRNRVGPVETRDTTTAKATGQPGSKSPLPDEKASRWRPNPRQVSMSELRGLDYGGMMNLRGKAWEGGFSDHRGENGSSGPSEDFFGAICLLRPDGRST